MKNIFTTSALVGTIASGCYTAVTFIPVMFMLALFWVIHTVLFFLVALCAQVLCAGCVIGWRAASRKLRARRVGA